MKMKFLIVLVCFGTACGGSNLYNTSKSDNADSAPLGAIELTFGLPDPESLSEAGVTHYSVETTPRDCTYSGSAVTTRPVESVGTGFLFPNCDQDVVIALGTTSASDIESQDAEPEAKDFPFTYITDIKPYVDASCASASCHGGAQPPLLKTYEDVFAAGVRVNARIQAGTMPIGGLPTADESQKAMFAQWAKDGFPEQNAPALTLALSEETNNNTLKTVFFTTTYPITAAQAVAGGHRAAPLTFTAEKK
ncbi:MAG: hypothetical protein AB7T49_15550 [Oligoflexales bacterium]